jgi:hypothetical protein
MRPFSPAVLLFVAAFTSSGAAVAQPSIAEMEDRSAAIAERYLQQWSASSSGAIGEVPYVYGPRVRFYGRDYTQGMLMDEKRRAIRKWPVRRYTHRPGTMQVICSRDTLKCAVRSTIDYAVSNPEAGTRARGASSFDLGVSFAGPQPVILYEGGARSIAPERGLRPLPSSSRPGSVGLRQPAQERVPADAA